MVAQAYERAKVFISYSHKDAKWLERLRVHLKPLEREHRLEIWDDTRIKPGTEWREEIREALAACKVAVLLVSADFLASDFIATDELPPLLNVAEKEGVVILPLILSPSRFLRTTGIAKFLAVNDPSKPLIGMTRGGQEAVLVKVSEAIEAALTSAAEPVHGHNLYTGERRIPDPPPKEGSRPSAPAAPAAHAYALVGEMTQPPAREGETRWRFTKRAGPLDNLWQSALTALTGRDDELAKLTSLFSGAPPPDAVARRHVICGEAGMGKSVLARQVVERVDEKYRLRWWIDAEDELKIRSGLRELARRLGIPSADLEVGAQGDQETDAHRYLNDLREYFDSDLLSGRALVVLDNVDENDVKRNLEKTVLRYLPPRTCDVLITSQTSQHWRPLAKITHLRGLPLNIGAELIAVESDRPALASDPDVKGISTMFGGRPLFLKQVAALLSDGDEPASFRAQLARTPEKALGVLPENESLHPLSRVTYAMAVERAERTRPGARQLLEVLSCWAAEPIPDWLVSAVQLRDVASIEAALHTLFDRSLIERQGDPSHRSYTVHRVVAALVKTLAKERQALPHALGLAAAATLNTIPGRDRLRHPEGQRLMAGLAPHVSALMHHTEEFMSLGVSSETVKTVAECASMMGLHLWTMSEWEAVEKAYNISVELSEHIKDYGSAALRKIRLANVLRQRGQFQKAEDIVLEAMPDLRRFGEPCDYAWGITAEARILRTRPNSNPQRALERLYDALPILEGSERRHEPVIRRQLSELHGYISVLHRQLFNLGEAEKESKEGLRLIVNDMSPEEILQAEELPDDYLLATHVRALGGVWRLRGDFRRATLAHQRALEIFERIYGRDHGDIYRALDSLGRVQREWGDLEAAFQTFERAGQVGEKLFGASYAYVGTAAINRALVYLELGQPDKAYAETVLGLSIYRVAYKESGDNSKLQNEATVWALFVQADALAALGELDRAARDHECVLAWRLAHQRPSHAHQASSYFALAEVIWRRDGDAALKQVLDYHQQALTIREQVFEADPNFWIAQSQARLGYFTRDVGLLERAYECFSRQLKPGHWRTRAVAEAMGELNRQQSRSG